MPFKAMIKRVAAAISRSGMCFNTRLKNYLSKRQPPVLERKSRIEVTEGEPYDSVQRDYQLHEGPCTPLGPRTALNDRRTLTSYFDSDVFLVWCPGGALKVLWKIHSQCLAWTWTPQSNYEKQCLIYIIRRGGVVACKFSFLRFSKDCG